LASAAQDRVPDMWRALDGAAGGKLPSIREGEQKSGLQGKEVQFDRGQRCHRGENPHHRPKGLKKRGNADMPEQSEKRKEAEKHVTDELANQAKQDPGSPEEAESKERRAQAEREFRDTK
jgi:hypothetical protein